MFESCFGDGFTLCGVVWDLCTLWFVLGLHRLDLVIFGGFWWLVLFMCWWFVYLCYLLDDVPWVCYFVC